MDDDELREDELDEGVVRKVLDDEGESAPLSRGGLGSLRLNQLCFRAMFGVILEAGSHSRHLLMKSKKRGSLQPLRAV